MADKVFDLFKEVVDVCEKGNLKYWVVGGFAFDAVRSVISRVHGDIDLCIHENDLDKSFRMFSDHNFRLTKEGLKYVFYKNEVKVDIFVLVEEGDHYERKREWFSAKYPKEIFDNYQILNLEGIDFRVPSNEGIKYYGSKTKHQKDKEFTENLQINEKLYSKIIYYEFEDYLKSKKDVKIEEITL